jgi:Bacterial Ig-like domain (group 3)
VRRQKIFTMVAAAAGVALMAAVVTASPARADTDPTTTTLTLASHRVVFGFEGTFQMLVGVNASSGSWSITAGSPATGSVALCGGDLSSSTSCFMPAGALPPGNYNVVAVYSGTENSSPSASTLEPLTVIAQQPTATSLTLSSATVIVGHEQSEDLEFRVAGDTGNSAEGPVTVLAGSTPLSQCTNIEVFGAGGCSLNASELPPGTYQLTARFDGSQNFAGSTSAPQTLTVVAQQPTTTSLTLSAPSVPFGNEQTETLTANVTPAVSGTPTGNVTVKTGATTVCTIALANATGKCTLTASQLPPGSYPLTATYSGDDIYTTSADTAQTLTVAKEPTTTDLALSADTIAVGSEQAELFTVQVTPATSGTPTGNVTVKAGATAVCTIILTNGTGNCTLTPRQLARGSYQITATYNGDTTDAKSTSSPPQTLTVTRR